ncbi:hypothetical protein BH20VER1_BH20VER1_32160 [soil metagenome]|jgi:hypothetical protein
MTWKRLLLHAVLPIASTWARRQERRILRAGVPLDERQLADARLVGIVQPERIRLLIVDKIPPRVPLSASSTIGMALGYGIFLRRDYCGNRALLLHELAHTAQYERLGFRGFLRRYLDECLTCGYPGGALEMEASRVAEELCA